MQAGLLILNSCLFCERGFGFVSRKFRECANDKTQKARGNRQQAINQYRPGVPGRSAGNGTAPGHGGRREAVAYCLYIRGDRGWRATPSVSRTVSGRWPTGGLNLLRPQSPHIDPGTRCTTAWAGTDCRCRYISHCHCTYPSRCRSGRRCRRRLARHW